VDVKLRDPASGAERPGTADVVMLEARHRRLLAAGLAAVGVMGGGCSILTPGTHLVMVWLGPLLGIGLGLAASSMVAWVRHTDGTCPTCDRPLSTRGPGPLWQSPPTLPCPHCHAALRLDVPG